MRCVTLSGDMFDPVGTLTGGMYVRVKHTHTHTRTHSRYITMLYMIGSRPKGPPLLIELVKLKDVSTQLSESRGQLALFDNELKKINELASR